MLEGYNFIFFQQRSNTETSQLDQVSTIRKEAALAEKKMQETLYQRSLVELNMAKMMKQKKEELLNQKLEVSRNEVVISKQEVEEHNIRIETAKIEREIAQEKLRLFRETKSKNN